MFSSSAPRVQQCFLFSGFKRHLCRRCTFSRVHLPLRNELPREGRFIRSFIATHCKHKLRCFGLLSLGRTCSSTYLSMPFKTLAKPNTALHVQFTCTEKMRGKITHKWRLVLPSLRYVTRKCSDPAGTRQGIKSKFICCLLWALDQALTSQI